MQFTLLGKELSRDMTLAHITLIPTEGKDPKQWANYRPISLLNIDLKLLAKLLANRLAALLPSVVHGDQVGEGRDNTTRVLNRMQFSVTRSRPLLLLSTDAEKAFDRINWSFLRHILYRFGLPDPFVQATFAMYAQASASVLINGDLSDPFDIQNGTRQGALFPPCFSSSL